MTSNLDQVAIEMPGPVGLVVSTTCDVPVALPGRAIVLPERFTTELGPDSSGRAGARDRARRPARPRMVVARRHPRARVFLSAAQSPDAHTLSHAASETSDAALLDQIEQVLEAAIFEDPNHSVRGEAIDALEELSTERAKRVLRKVIDRHPDAQMREEAVEREREWSH
jgi:HEAT repeats